MSEVAQADKITLARESRGLTQVELAERVGISQGQVSKIELGMLPATPVIVSKIAAVLNYPEALFYLTDQIYGVGPNDLYHRKRQSTSSRLMRKIYAHINLRRIQISRLLKAFSLSCHVHPYDVDEEPNGEVAIATRVRAMWHVPPGPLPNLTGLVERAGAIIVPCHFDTPLVDGVSQWLPGLPPLFFINRSMARSRWRMTIAHELAHVVMHARPNPEMENQATRFASEFLMPGIDMRSHLGVFSGLRSADACLQKLAELKLIWRVSMQGILVRATELGAIGKSLGVSIWKRINQLGYRKAEPYEDQLPIEHPSTLRELVARHVDRLGFSVAKLAEALYLSPAEFRQLYLPEEVGHLRAV